MRCTSSPGVTESLVTVIHRVGCLPKSGSLVEVKHLSAAVGKGYVTVDSKYCSEGQPLG